jgi:hypothetical protein
MGNAIAVAGVLVETNADVIADAASDAAAADDSDATVSDLLQDHVAVEHARHAFT